MKALEGLDMDVVILCERDVLNGDGLELEVERLY